MGLCQIRKASVQLKYIIKMKREPIVWESIFANDTSDKGLISKIDKELI